ncbi:MAG: TRAP transporter substrate-binding protein DctP [Deltaproteobacteria bacterium]|nr:TRAP transporter substrate-binding protein DctP [Deltaproteobacteria bacterium]
MTSTVNTAKSARTLAARTAAFALFGTLAFASGSAEANKVKVKLGTLAPEGTVWHDVGLRIGQRWAEVDKGIELKIYPGGVVGDEGDMVRKMRIGQLHAALITGVGLGQIHRSAIALQVPMLIESWAELEYIRERVGPTIEKEMDAAGFIVLGWGDAGWVHQFSKVPAKTPDDFRKLKMFVWSGDPEAEKAWRAAKFNVVPLSVTDVLASLQTGMIESFGTTPLYAMTSNWYKTAKHMVKVNWSPLNGGIVITKEQWEKIDAGIRPKLMQIAREEGMNLRSDVQKLNESAIGSMKERGLTVVEADAALTAEWKKAAELAYPSIRGNVVPAPLFDEIQRLSKEFRAQPKK